MDLLEVEELLPVGLLLRAVQAGSRDQALRVVQITDQGPYQSDFARHTEAGVLTICALVLRPERVLVIGERRVEQLARLRRWRLQSLPLGRVGDPVSRLDLDGRIRA